MQTFSFDDFYAKFQKKFRGDEAMVKQRLAEFLPPIQKLIPIILDKKVLDLGCGNGLWLDLLKENNIPCYGVDTNTISLAEAKNKGHDIITANGVDYLKTLPDNSVGVITAFHLIEHLTFPDFVTLSQEIYRTLTPGGLVIYESPNPRNLITGVCNFYKDPTHLKPVPAEFCAFLMEYLDFSNVQIQELTRFRNLKPWDHLSTESNILGKFVHLILRKSSSALNNLNKLTEFMNQHIENASDYAVIAYKAFK